MSKKRCIYAFEFVDNHVYIGLTCNLKTRTSQHHKKGIVYKHIQKNLNFNLKQLTDYLEESMASELEICFIKQYVSDGWILLNDPTKGGYLGGKINKWTKQKCHEIALKYNDKKEFIKDRSCFEAARRNGWLKDICSHMISHRKENGYWTREKCQIEALKYESRSDFQKKNRSCYEEARSKGFLDDICAHMGGRKKYPIHWTKEKCQLEALKYESRIEFIKKNKYCYMVSLTQGYLNEICSHMASKKIKQQ